MHSNTNGTWGTNYLPALYLDFKSGGVGKVDFDVRLRLKEKERKNQVVVVAFSLYLTTKPNIVKFEVEGPATLSGKGAEISKML